MRILFVALRFHTNQVPLTRALIQAGHEILFEVLSEGQSEDHSMVRPHLMPIAWLPQMLMRMRNPVNPTGYRADHAYPALLWYLRRLRSLAPDVVVVRDPNRPYAWRAAVAARLLGMKIVLYTQGDVHGRPSRRTRWTRDAAMRVFDAVWFSPVSGDRRLPKVHRDAYFVPFAADLERRVKSSWFEGERVNVLGVGKFTSRKNHALLLDAFDWVRRRHALHLTLVGEVSTEEHRAHHAAIVESIRARGLRDQVTVRTNVPFGELPELYLKHDLFVLPSHDEPASVAILEAMAHGLPVICSTTCGTRWYLDPGRSGLVFRSNDRQDLIDTLSHAVEDRDRMIRMGTHGRAIAETAHHPEAVADAFAEVVRERRKRA